MNSLIVFVLAGLVVGTRTVRRVAVSADAEGQEENLTLSDNVEIAGLHGHGHRNNMHENVHWLQHAQHRGTRLKDDEQHSVSSDAGSEDTSEPMVKMDAGAELAVGATFASRFLLLQKLWRHSVQNTMDPLLPRSIADTVAPGSEKFLGKGSFGMSWKAKDLKHGGLVVIKVFYYLHSEQSPIQFLKWDVADSDPSLKAAAELAAVECAMARAMQKYATADGEGRAAQRIMRCYEDHVRSPVSVTGHSVAMSDTLYQVLEYSGDQDLQKWMALPRSDPSKYFVQALQVYRQIIEGLHYLTSHETAWVHHDLKPANIVVKETSDGNLVAKLIDFGSVTEATKQNAERSDLPQTPWYAPPECFNFKPVFEGEVLSYGVGYDFENFHAFDVYSAGVVLEELITGPFIKADRMLAAFVYYIMEKNLVSQATFTERYANAQSQCHKGLFLGAIVKPRVSADNFKVAQKLDADELLSKYRLLYTVSPTAMKDLLDQDCAPLLTRWSYGERERYVTAKFGHADGSKPWSSIGPSLWDTDFEAVFFNETNLEGERSSFFKTVIPVAKKHAKENSWGELFLRMLAWDTDVRPLPKAILESGLLKDVPSVSDPDWEPMPMPIVDLPSPPENDAPPPHFALGLVVCICALMSA
jgi:serine/threonine protein kinase